MSGDFFAIDKTRWTQLFRQPLVMNPAVAYLVLARFTAADNRTTTAGAHAIEKHTGIGRGRAAAAIEDLRKAGHIKAAGKRAIAGRPTTVHQFPAHRPADLIWLPNEIVTGAADESPPLEIVRQTQDPMTLRLFVELYGAQNLRDDGGISRRLIFQKHERYKAGQSGAFVVWAFGPGASQAYMDRVPLSAHLPTANELSAATKTRGQDFYSRLARLEKTRLIDWVPHIFESDGPEAEAIISLTPESMGRMENDAISAMEGELARAAQQGGFDLLTEAQGTWVDQHGLWLVPMPAHLDNVQAIGVARLRYKPRTKLTGAWFAEHQRTGQKWLDVFTGISAKRAAG